MNATDRVSVTDAGILMMAADELKFSAAELKAAHTLLGSSDWGTAPDQTPPHHERMLWLVERLHGSRDSSGGAVAPLANSGRRKRSRCSSAHTPDQPTARIARHMRPFMRSITRPLALASCLRVLRERGFQSLQQHPRRYSLSIPEGSPPRTWTAPARLWPWPMRETQFKRGHWPANRDPTITFGAAGKHRRLHRHARQFRTWRARIHDPVEDAHGPVPPGYCLAFKDGDRLNVELANSTISTASACDATPCCRRGSPRSCCYAAHSCVDQPERKHEEQDRRSA